MFKANKRLISGFWNITKKNITDGTGKKWYG